MNDTYIDVYNPVFQTFPKLNTRQRHTQYKRQTTQLCKHSTNWQMSDRKNWSYILNGRLTPRQTGRPTIGRNITLTSTLTLLDLVSTRNKNTQHSRKNDQSPWGKYINKQTYATLSHIIYKNTNTRY
jgi:hypothetical protein